MMGSLFNVARALVSRRLEIFLNSWVLILQICNNSLFHMFSTYDCMHIEMIYTLNMNMICTKYAADYLASAIWKIKINIVLNFQTHIHMYTPSEVEWCLHYHRKKWYFRLYKKYKESQLKQGSDFSFLNFRTSNFWLH